MQEKEKLEQQKREAERQENEKKAELQAAALAHEEEERLKNRQQAEPESTPKEEPSVIKKEEASDDYWKKIVEDFTKKYEKEPEENGNLVFASDEEAINFFTDQAAQKREFLVQKYSEGKATGFHVFSCGDGILYKGSLEEIHKEVQAAKAENPEKTAMYDKALATLQKYMPTPNPAASMKDKLGEMKKPEDTAPAEELSSANAPGKR